MATKIPRAAIATLATISTYSIACPGAAAGEDLLERVVGRLEDRLQEALEPVGYADELPMSAGNADEARDDRAHGQDLQGHGHRGRRLVDVVLGLVACRGSVPLNVMW